MLVQLTAQKKCWVITKFVGNEHHNHDLNEVIAASLSKNRSAVLKDPNVAATAKLLFKGGVKPCKVRPLLKAMVCGQVTARDLQNFR